MKELNQDEGWFLWWMALAILISSLLVPASFQNIVISIALGTVIAGMILTFIITKQRFPLG